MRVLYIGGTGEISLACVQASAAAGHAVSVFNRGRSNNELPPGIEQIRGDLADDVAYAALGDRRFDVVCQFKAYTPDEVKRDLRVFAGRCGQYVFISSASAYLKPPISHLITEATPLENPFWPYSAAKAAMENLLFEAHRAGQLSVTVVRPSHTYRRNFPGTFVGGDVLAWRMLQGQPVIVHGDGTSLWVVTHASDFARPFVALLGNPKAAGEAFHITSDQAWRWSQILQAMAAALEVEAQIVAVPTETLVRYNPSWSGPLWGDKSWSVSFDLTKLRSVAGDHPCQVAMLDGMKRVAGFVQERLKTHTPDAALHTLLDRIIADQSALGR